MSNGGKDTVQITHSVYYTLLLSLLFMPIRCFNREKYRVFSASLGPRFTGICSSFVKISLAFSSTRLHSPPSLRPMYCVVPSYPALVHPALALAFIATRETTSVEPYFCNFFLACVELRPPQTTPHPLHPPAGFTASAILGPNPSAGANAFRGDPFGPGAHAHPRGSGGGGSGGCGSLGRSNSHDSSKTLPAFGWPNIAGGGSGGSGGGGGGSGHSHSKSTGASSLITTGSFGNGGAWGSAGGVGSGGGVSGAGGGGGGCGRSIGGRSSSATNVAHHDLQTVPDRPMSLFEGLAGAATYLADMVPDAGAGEHAWFPSLKL